MKRLLLLILLIVPIKGYAQLNEGLIQMAKHYRQFVLRNTLTESAIEDFDKLSNTELKFTAQFIKETLTDNNKLLSVQFLTRPNDKDLRYIYIVELINYNIRKENPVDNNELIANLLKRDISGYELLHTYYSMFFTGYGNKVKPYNMANVNFKLNTYGLKNDTEKGILFLEAMRFNGTMIWGYMNIPKPPRYDKAMDIIKLYPHFNDSPYYQYLDFSFPDFKINITSETSTQSYKEYYLDKYYETLINHLTCLGKLEAIQDQMNDIVLGSILKERAYYKYSKREDELKKLLTVYKKD